MWGEGVVLVELILFLLFLFDITVTSKTSCQFSAKLPYFALK